MCLLFVMLLMAAQNKEIYYIYRIVYPFLIWIKFDVFRKFPKEQWWIKCTIFYYGMQVIVITNVHKLLSDILVKNTLLQILSNIIIPASCMSIMIFMACIIRKTVPKIWKVLVGGR